MVVNWKHPQEPVVCTPLPTKAWNISATDLVGTSEFWSSFVLCTDFTPDFLKWQSQRTQKLLRSQKFWLIRFLATFFLECWYLLIDLTLCQRLSEFCQVWAKNIAKWLHFVCKQMEPHNMKIYTYRTDCVLCRPLVRIREWLLLTYVLVISHITTTILLC